MSKQILKKDAKEAIKLVNDYLKEYYGKTGNTDIPEVALWSYGIENCKVGLRFKGIDEETLEAFKESKVEKDTAKKVLNAIKPALENTDVDTAVYERIVNTLSLLNLSEFNFEDPHDFFCKVLSNILKQKVTKVIKKEHLSKEVVITVESEEGTKPTETQPEKAPEKKEEPAPKQTSAEPPKEKGAEKKAAPVKVTEPEDFDPDDLLDEDI